MLLSSLCRLPWTRRLWQPVGGLALFVVFFLQTPPASAHPPVMPPSYVGYYEGHYEDGPWYWPTKQSFNFFLSPVSGSKPGEIYFYHPLVGPCQGNYVINLSKGNHRFETPVIYSANLNCSKERQRFYVFQLALASSSALARKVYVGGEFFLRSAKDHRPPIWAEATFTYLAPTPQSQASTR